MCIAIYGPGHIWQEVISLVSVLHPGSLGLSVYVHKTMKLLICVSAVPQSILWKPFPICVVLLLWCRPAYFFRWSLYLLILDLHYADNDVWERLLMLCKLDWGQFISCCGVSMCSERWCDMIDIPAHLINGPQGAKASNAHSEILSQKNASADEDHAMLLKRQKEMPAWASLKLCVTLLLVVENIE